MNFYIKQLVVLGFLFFGMSSHAQQKNNYSFYRQNMNILNPAYAGADGNTVLTGSIRSQWQGVKDAPESQTFSFGTAMVKRVGLGLSVENDKTFVEKQTTVNLDFSYMLPLGANLDLYLGIKAGGNFYDVNASGLNTWNYDTDPSLENLSRFNPNMGIGAYLKHDNFYISLSAPRIFETKRAKEEEGLVTTAADRIHYYLSGGYDLPLNDLFTLKPSIMMRYVQGAPLSTDFTALLNVDQKFEFGGSYRTDKAFTSLFFVNVLKWLQAGYAYENSWRSEISNVSGGTHEILVKFIL